MNKRQEKINQFEKIIQAVQEEFLLEYEELAQESERIFDQQEELEKKYAELDKKSGLNALFEKFARLKEKE